LDDLFTHKFKTWRDYMNSFFSSMRLSFSKAVQQMIWDFLGFKKATEGMSSGGGFNLGSLLGGAVGVIGGVLGLGGGPERLGIGYSSAKHAGGFVTKHEGGLQRDEVIAKLLSNEYVLRRESAQSIGRERLDYMNREGRMPSDKPIIVTPPEVKILNLLDPRQIVAQALYDQPNLIINPITSNSQLVRRILER